MKFSKTLSFGGFFFNETEKKNKGNTVDAAAPACACEYA